MKRRLRVLAGLLMTVAVLTACDVRSQVETAALPPAAISPGNNPTPLPTVTMLPVPPTRSAVDSESTTVLAPPSPTPLALATATAPVVATSEPGASPLPATATPTPAPTFTPPPPPPADPAEHFTFSRPVPADSPQWTDKAYPYGSTRGGTLQIHHGVEFNVPTGTPVLAAGDGVVRFAGSDDVTIVGPQLDFYGQVIVVEHTQATGSDVPVFTVYGHLSELKVASGQRVSAGEVIGISGDSGVAYGPHLHFEVREGEDSYGATRNPLLWLKPFPGLGTVAARITWPDGRPVLEAPVVLRRVDGEAPYTAGTTYAAGGVNSDDQRQENIVLDDVVPGYYELEINGGTDIVRQTLWIYPNRTTFLTLSLP